ncbi:hypothetical protein [Desulfosudis oleivorans]|nr:hypothetical protein [Desulfosudis oleivorans]
MRCLFIGLIFLSLFFAGPVGAEDEVFHRLLAAKCLKCNFQEGVSTSWPGKEINVESCQWKSETVFDAMNIRQARARVIGNQGTSDVMLLGSPSGLTFLESTCAGNMIFTTVFPFYKPGTDEFCAVMSRHMNLTNKALPSQYYGTCKVLK